ncbi:helix-turn-helix domain-containing protein [Paenibacillus glycinis]|uniref:Helix-turn-helix domain-containing protein n=1 Tax=Paenibacillus glycinis TaxID=2697035 RepID=A0ABW9XMP5_9BACL|nr:AraC family transcriptional regulator [Paenibacillus glycinis]NBD23885.1 helix-turn-helix domain-containing protein [Paenibacillus glycinis]
MNHQLDFLLQNAELKIVEFDMNCRTEMRTFKRTLPYYMMSYHKKGSAKLRVGDETYDIPPGSIIYVPMNVEHDHFKTRTDETEFLWWHFTLQIAGVMDVMKMFQIPYLFKLNDAEAFERVFMQFMEATSTSRPLLLSAILKQAKALELLYMILDSAISRKDMIGNPMQSQSFLNLLARIVQHPQEQLSLQSLSEELHMHPTYICNRFKELFGKSPMQVQREMKIQRAKTLLETSEMSITEIAQALGSNELQNFTRLFKSYVGVSPTQYRNLKLKWRNTP